jgi:hypothetical protein
MHPADLMALPPSVAFTKPELTGRQMSQFRIAPKISDNHRSI